MKLNVPEIIRRKRDGERLGDDELRALIGEYTADRIPDYQMAALLMAIFFCGLDTAELAVWTDAMTRSGAVMRHDRVRGPKVDKHSTGGVGDKISLCLAPAVAACGVPVPMISGRGLGHTGGTLDKLESIPGFRVDLEPAAASAQLERLGLFLIGQTEDVAPADRRLYALRDVTGTVESIPLIASSIMSKKLAEGIDALVLDVKVGEGAFMETAARARELARTIIDIGAASGVAVRALLTDMGAPIGRTVGNSLEAREAIDVLRGGGPSDTIALTIELGAEMLVLGKAAKELEAGRASVRRVLADGTALALFARVIEAQRGDPRVCDDPSRLPVAAHRDPLAARRRGYVTGIRPRAVAMAALEVGAGRRRKEDDIDPSAGVELLVARGDLVEAGAPLAALHHGGSGEGEAMRLLESAFEIGDAPPASTALVIDRL
jgi:pyrimidine-nucleoside phosphorylase